MAGRLLADTAGLPEVDGSAAAAAAALLGSPEPAPHQELRPVRREERNSGTAAVAVEGLRAEGCILL